MSWLMRLDRLCAGLLLVPFLVLALLPAQAMPALGPDGLTLEFCDGGSPDGAGGGDPRCAWAQGAVALPVPAAVPVAAVVLRPVAFAPARPQVFAVPVPPHVLARGPPAL
jgi:hypothetical protein